MSNTIGKALRKARHSKDLTIAQAAKGSHISPASISNWETGRTIPHTRSLKTIADFYQVNSASLKNGKVVEQVPSTDEATETVQPIELESLVSGAPLTLNKHAISPERQTLIATFIGGLLAGESN